jgi:mRNA interferase MazF
LIFRRADIVTAAFQGDLKKPRPAVILQADEYNAGQLTLLVCPLTTYLAESSFFRPVIEPTPENGLEFRSQVMVDKTSPLKKTAFGSVIGRLSVEDMTRVEFALINITGLHNSLFPLPGKSGQGNP